MESLEVYKYFKVIYIFDKNNKIYFFIKDLEESLKIYKITKLIYRKIKAENKFLIKDININLDLLEHFSPTTMVIDTHALLILFKYSTICDKFKKEIIDSINDRLKLNLKLLEYVEYKIGKYLIKLTDIFYMYNTKTKYKCLDNYIDFYFIDLNIAVNFVTKIFDEYEKDREKKRNEKIYNQLKCHFFTFHTYDNFVIEKAAGSIFDFIVQCALTY